MELSTYLRILTRWLWLVVAGTMLAAAIGVGVEYRSRVIASSPTFQATASVFINSATPGGTYIAGISIADVENNLMPHVKDPGATQISPRVPGPPFSSLTANINPTTGDIDVQAVAPTSADARLAANRAAHYLANLEIADVKAEAKYAIRNYQHLAKIAKAGWLRNIRLRFHTPPSHRLRRLILGDKASQWQSLLLTDEDDIDGFKHPALPAATVFPAHHTSKYQAKALSPIKTVIPAAIVGLVLSFLLAALLESRRANPATDSPAESETMPEFQSQTLVPGEPMPAEAPEDVPVAASADEPGDLPVPAPMPPELAPDEPVQLKDSRSEMMIALAEPMAQTADLISRLIDSSRPSIFVTSPTSGEPKSESSAGLAVSLALSGKRVVLVDADPAANLTRFFELTDRPGLSDYLGYPQGPLHQLVYPANLSATNGSLWVLPYGIRRHDGAAFAGPSGPGSDSQAWSRALGQLAPAGVIVIVDGPTVLDNPGLLDSTAEMGGVIVALERERTGPDVTQTYDILRARGARLLGVVANPTSLRLDSTGPDAPSQGFPGPYPEPEPLLGQAPEPRFPWRESDPFQRR